ncbi:MAG: hypothetical protein IJ411_04625 [Oscillospiraceae bacterium]|nr:hypothetical protein [Oscillospiraceae bacterium]
MKKSYDDIINLPHHVSTLRPRMSAIDRAAQFSPFAALTGYEAQIRETARLTDQRVELDDCAQAILNDSLRQLQERIREKPEAVITYFLPDDRKNGGSYETVRAKVKKLDCYQGLLILEDETRIHVSDLYELEL